MFRIDWKAVGRFVIFVVLVGVLVYLLASA